MIAPPVATGVAVRGAQFFTALGSEFRALVAASQTAGIVDACWYTQDERVGSVSWRFHITRGLGRAVGLAPERPRIRLA